MASDTPQNLRLINDLETLKVISDSIRFSIFQIISQQVNSVELITGYEGNAFASTGNIAEDLLAITSVHPMREEAVRVLLAKSGEDWAGHAIELYQGDVKIIELNKEAEGGECSRGC